MATSTRVLTRRLVLACLVALASALLVLPGPGPTGSTYAAGARIRASIVFHKNWKDPHDGTLVWKVERRQRDGSWKQVERASWRAGSGFRGRAAKRECVKGKGWLPNGSYSFVQYNDYHGQLIKGRAFYLGNKTCRNGTLRTDLFIHTESGAHNKQCPDRKGDQLCRWEFPRINDYRSYGCVKMSPGDLADLVRHFHDWFHAGVRYPVTKVRVRVVS